MQNPNSKIDRISHTNIINIQNKNLIVQNCYLIDELNKYKANSNAQNPSKRLNECSCSIQLFQFYGNFKRFLQQILGDLESVFDRLGDFDSATLSFFKSHFGRLEQLVSLFFVDIEDSNCGPIEDGIRAITTKTIQSLASTLFKVKNPPHARGTGDFDNVSDAQTTGMQEVPKGIEKLNGTHQAVLENRIVELEARISSLNWKNHILEKRLAFGQNVVLEHSLDAIKSLIDNPDYYCYCGGKYIKELTTFSNSEISQKIKTGFSNFFHSLLSHQNPNLGQKDGIDQNHSEYQKMTANDKKNDTVLEEDIKFFGEIINDKKKSSDFLGQGMEIETDVSKQQNLYSSHHEKLYKSQIEELQKSNQLLLEVAEIKRIEKIAGIKNIIQTNFFKQITSENKRNIDLIALLENKIKETTEILGEIDELRKKEAYEFREKLLKEREKYFDEIALLKNQITELKNKNELLNIQKDGRSTNGNPGPGSDPKPQQEISVLLQKTYQAIKNIIFKQKEALLMRDKTIKELETTIENIKNTSIHEQLLINTEFRHQTHSELFAQFKTMLPIEFSTKVEELEKYVKSREEKIKMLGKDFKQLTKDLQNERATSASLLNEIAGSCNAYEKLRTALDSVNVELSNSIEAFNIVFKEKQINKINFERRIQDLESMVQLLNDKNSIKATQLESLGRELRDLNQFSKTNKNKIKEMQTSLTELILEKNELSEKLTLALGEREFTERRLEGTEASQARVVKELAESISENALFKSIQKQLLEILEQKKLLPTFEELDFGKENTLTLDQRGRYLLRVLEADDFKVI